MNKYFIAAAIGLLSMVSSHAQQQSQTANDRIAMQIGRLLIQIENQIDQINQLTQNLAAKEIEIKKLKENQLEKKE